MKIYTVVLTSVLLLFFSKQIIVACAGGEEEDLLDYSAFAPEIIEQPQFSPFYFTYFQLYQTDQAYTPLTSYDFNINEWYAFFDNKITKDDLSWLVYTCNSKTLRAIESSLWNTAKLPDTIPQKSLINLRLKDEITEVITYLDLAKSAETIFNPNANDWYQPVINDSAGAVKFQIPFLKGMIRNRNLFLKQRFGFQLMRAYYYSHEYQKAINVMKLIPKLNATSGSIYYRTLGYLAAAYYKQHAYQESNLIYAKLYSDYEPLRISSYRSFHLMPDTTWNENLAMAKTSLEKESLWHLYGLYANPLKAMHHIYNLNPKSELIPLLMVRNVNIIETIDLQYPKNIYADEQTWSYYAYKREPFIDSNMIAQNGAFDYSNKQQVLQVLHHIIDERKVPAITPYLLSAAYLHTLSGQYTEANKLCSEAMTLTSNAIIKNQAEIIKTLLYVLPLKQINEANELEIERQLRQMSVQAPPFSRAQNAVNYLMYIIAQKYTAQGNSIKAELCYSSSLAFYKNSEAADSMIQYMEKTQHNDFEKHIIGRYHLSLDALYNIKGVKLLFEYNFEAAIAVFEKVKMEDLLPADPFKMRTVDCHDCDFAEEQTFKYTRKTFAQKMLDLKQSFESQKNKESAAEQLFAYANGLYNMTFFGNGRFIASSPISWMEDSYADDIEQKKQSSENYYNCEEALKYYTQAQSITKDKEFAAKCAWGAAKCEHNLKLMGYMPWQSQIAADFEAGNYFLEMKTKYVGTKYYKEVLNECGYFCSYITKDTLCIRDKWSLRNR